MRQIKQAEFYRVTSESGKHYIVYIKRLPNDINGNGKAEYIILPLDDRSDISFMYRGFYTTNGQREAENAVWEHEKKGR